MSIRILAAICILTAAAWARVTISPSSVPVVGAGTAQHFSANTAVKWSLAPGSAGTVDRDGTYHAPASIHVKNVVAGCQVLPNDHIFNTRIDRLPVDANSTAYMAAIPQSGVNYYPGWGLNIADHATPSKAFHFLYTPQNDGKFEMLAWPDLKRESGVFSDTHSPTDRHVVTIDRDTCDVFELYNDYKPGDNTSCPTCTAQSGFHYNAMDARLPSGSVDAAGLLLTPLTLGLAEIRSGAIEHALRVTFKNHIIARRPVWPAQTYAGAWGIVPYGTRFRLKASFETSRFSKYAQVLLKQLKEYGLIIADGGGNWDISTLTDVTLDPVVQAALEEVARAPRTADFEVVDESPLLASSRSGQIKLGGDGYATLIATSESDPSDTASVHITLRGITAGVPEPAKWIQSGVSVQLKSWVNGTTDKQVHWSMSPSLGTLTAEGLYTAPSVDRPMHTTATVTSSADGSAKADLDVTVLPAGSIRITVGNATRAPGAPNKRAPDYGPDSEGHMWWRGQAGEVSWGVIVDDSAGQLWPKMKDLSLFYTSRYSFGDMNYGFTVPNGSYKITLLFVQPQCDATFPKSYRIPFHIETQGKLVIPNFDMGAGIADACHTPVVQSIPATVIDHSLYFSLRRVTIKDHMPSPILTAFSIEQDKDPPHLSVSPQRVSVLTASQQIQFRTIGWNMSDKAQWSLVKGGGSITADGLYTAPAVPPSSDQAIVLQAKSLSDSTKTATAEMTFRFGELALSPASSTVARSLSQKFTAAIDRANYSNLKWSVSPPVGTIARDGTYTAPDNLSQDTEVKITAESADVPGRTATAKLLVKANPETIRIDCGFGGFKDEAGNTWSADYGFSKDTMSYRNPIKIAGASEQMQQLYQSSRYRYSDANFSYAFDLPNGKYALTLKWADYTFDSPGHYNFDVVVNGRKVLTNFDPDTVNGPKTAVDKTFEVAVTGKKLQIDFLGHKGGALINGIQIAPLGN